MIDTLCSVVWRVGHGCAGTEDAEMVRMSASFEACSKIILISDFTGQYRGWLVLRRMCDALNDWGFLDFLSLAARLVVGIVIERKKMSLA